MRENEGLRALTSEEVKIMESRGCQIENPANIIVANEFDATKARNTEFSGKVKIGALNGEFELPSGLKIHSGISNARIHNCNIGNGVYIHNVAGHIANYDIGDEAFVDNVDSLVCTPGSTFGQGSEVSVLNETGGREVMIYEGMSAQMAYLLAMFRHNNSLIKRLNALITERIAPLKHQNGRIGNHARILNCGTLTNVMVGDYAAVEGASRLVEGTIASSAADPVYVGANVIAENFIFCSGAKVDDGALVMNSYVGQACQINHLFSAHDSLFFANCVCENGEAAAIFAGPYTVTMHKSSLLIAGMFSFLNAGSGSNQSNHMYKLGPVHQGVVARGSKTASDSYILWPAKIGAFSLVMGRHINHPDTSNLPFSYLIEKYGRSFLAPGVNLKSVGTIRDARKWPQRDKRRGEVLLDRINFNLLSPFTAEKMMEGLRVLHDIETTGGETSDTYTYRGMTIEPRALEKGRRYYTLALDKFMGNSLIHRLRSISSAEEITSALAPTTKAGTGSWIDLAGMIAPADEIHRLCSEIVEGKLSLDDVEKRFTTLADDYYEMEWTWVAEHFAQWFGKELQDLTAADVAAITRRWHASVTTLDNMLYDDAKKDFSRVSQIGFGFDGSTPRAEEDFKAVRGEFINDPFVKMVIEHIETKTALAQDLLRRL